MKSFCFRIVFFCVLGPILFLIILIIIINIIQAKKPSLLPKPLQTWDFLPKWLHSLEPYDELVRGSCLSRFTHRHEHKSTDELSEDDDDNNDDDDDDGFEFMVSFNENGEQTFNSNQSHLYKMAELNNNKLVYSKLNSQNS